MLRLKWAFPVIAGFCLTTSAALAQDEAKATPAPGKAASGEAQPPPELTAVTGRLMYAADQPTTGGIGYWVFQRRLMEIPHENPLEKVRAMAETAMAIDEGGSFSLTMAPGNYALIFEPGAEATEDALQPGPESQSAARQRQSPEQIRARIEIIRDNAKRGLAIKDGRLGEAYVIENRQVRPPIVEFGEMMLAEDHSVRVIANNEAGKPIDFPATLRLRGKSGDIYEPHPPSVSEPGIYTFHDVFPQPYEVFALGSKPKEGAGDQVTTPTIENGLFVFDGTPTEQKVVVKPGNPNEKPRQAPADAPEVNKPSTRR